MDVLTQFDFSTIDLKVIRRASPSDSTEEEKQRGIVYSNFSAVRCAVCVVLCRRCVTFSSRCET